MRRCFAFSPGVGSGRGGRRCQVSPRGSGCPAASLILCVPSSSHCCCQQVPHPLRGASPVSTKPLGFPLSQDAWKLGVWEQTAPRPSAWLGHSAGGKSPQTLSGQCVCVHVCLRGSLCCASWSWDCSFLCPLPGFMPLVPGATAKALQTPWAESKASPSQPGIQGPAVWSCGAGPGGAGGTTEPLPCSHCPAQLDAGAGSDADRAGAHRASCKPLLH